MTALSFPQKICAVLILLIIVFFGLFRVTESPPFSFDEGSAVQVATNLSEFGIDGFQFAPDTIEHVSILTSIGYPLLYALAFWFKLFGVGIFQARVMMVVYMFGFAVVSFLLLKRLYGTTLALSSLALLVTFPPFYSFGKNVIGEVPVLFFLTLFLLFFNVATTHKPEKKRFWLILAGISAGLCIVTKTMALAFIPVLFIGAILARKKGLVSWRDIGVVAISAIIPVVVWLIVNFQPGDSLASVADYYSNPSALTDRTATFWLNLRKSFTSIGPPFMLSLMVVWITGVIIRVKAKMKIHIEESVALMFCVVLIFSLLFRYWDARYYFPVQVLAILFFPYSLYFILHALPIKFDIAQKTKIFVLGIVLMSVAGLYQLSFRSFIADSYTSTRTEDLSKYFSSIPDSTSMFFYNTPDVLPFFHGRNYYQRIAMFQKWVLGSEFAPLVTAGRVDMLVLGPLMTKADEKVSLDNYVKIAEFGKVRVLQRKAP